MTGLERAGRGGNQLFSKSFSTQVSGLLRTCTQKAHKQRDTNDFFSTATILPHAPASAASTMSRTAITVDRDINQHHPDRQTTHRWTSGETPGLLGLKM